MKTHLNPLVWLVLLIGLFTFVSKENERQSKIKEFESIKNIKAQFIRIDDNERTTHFVYSFNGQTYPVSTKEKVHVDPSTRTIDLSINRNNPGKPLFVRPIASYIRPEDLTFKRYHLFSIITFIFALIGAYKHGKIFSSDLPEKLRREGFAFFDSLKKQNSELSKLFAKGRTEPQGIGFTKGILTFYLLLNTGILSWSEYKRQHFMKNAVPVEATLTGLERSITKGRHYQETYDYSFKGQPFKFITHDFLASPVIGGKYSLLIDPASPQTLKKKSEGFVQDHAAFFMINLFFVLFVSMFAVPVYLIFRVMKWLASRMQSPDNSHGEEKTESDDRMAG